MKILVLMHIENEGPGTLGDYLLAKNVTLRICKLFDAEKLPPDPCEFDAVVSMGDPMNAYEDDKHPFLGEGEDLGERVKQGMSPSGGDPP